MQKTKLKTIRIVLMALLTALAYIMVFFFRIPIVLFLSYEPKDMIILLAAMLLGPIEGIVIAIVVSFLEMITISDTGIWGLLMNILSTVAFITPTALIYRKYKGLFPRIIGLIGGVLFMTIVMLLWNYFISPLYMGVPRTDIVPLLWSAFLPFNLLKASINASVSVLFFEPIEAALKRANLVPTQSEMTCQSKIILISISILLLVSSILFVIFFF